MPILKTLFSNKDYSSKFVFYLEKITHVADIKIQNSENESAISVIKNIESILYKFWQLKKTDPIRYNKLLVNNKEFDTYYKFYQSFEKLWNTAFKNNNEEIAIIIGDLFSNFLNHISCYNNNSSIIKTILNVMRGLNWEGLKNIDFKSTLRILIALSSWYINIVFYKDQSGRNFKLSYIDEFNEYYFYIIRDYIYNDNFDLFQYHIKSFVDSIAIRRGVPDLWQFFDIMLYDFPEGLYEDVSKKISLLAKKLSF